MLRRKLAAYTLLFIAGNAAGFFMLERSRPMGAAGFAASVIICVMLFPAGHEQIPGYFHDTSKTVKMILVMSFICGLLSFSVRCVVYGRIASAVSESGTVRGRVISAQTKDDDLKLVLRRTDGSRSKILLTVSGYAQEDEDTGSETETEEVFELTGAVIEASGEYKSIDPADDPGCFDYRLYMKSKGICVSLKAYSFEIIDPVDSFLMNIRRRLYRSREAFIGRFDTETAGFIRGVIFGDKSEIDEDTVKEFNENSTGHILAVSGLHVGFLYGLLRALTGRRRGLVISVFIIAVIIMYGEMTMWSPATVRACIVMSISLLSLHFRRPFDLLTSVSLAALLILIKEPYQLVNSGFQMSFMAMCGIAFFTKPIASVTGEALGVMLAVQAGTLPLIAYTFCRFNPLSVLINVPIILLASLLVPLCISMLMMEIFLGTIPKAVVDIIGLISYAELKMNHLLNFEGSFSLKAAGLRGAAVIGVYLLLLGASSEWARVQLLRSGPAKMIRNGALLLIPVVMLGSCMYDPFSDDEIVFVAVGQGDCVHIRAEDHDILIDGGGSDVYNVGEKILMPYLLHEGAYKTDMALVTHLHADHYKGIAELSEIYPVGAVGIPADYKGSVEGGSSPSFDVKKAFYIEPDTRIDIADDISVEPIWPVTVSNEPVAADDPNEHNTVYMIDYKGTKVMVTGDILEEDELEMVKYYEGTDTLKCDVLKVAHHGSKSSSSEAFLDAASPSVAVIQVGRNNFYGHPHEQTLKRLEERGIKVFRTDTNGAAGLDIRRGRIHVDLFHAEDRS